MFRNLKKLAEAAQAVAQELRLAREAVDAIRSDSLVDSEARGRIDALRLEHHEALARVEALLMDAEKKYKLARAAEERERHHKVNAEKAKKELEDLREEGADPFEEAGQRWLHLRDEEGGEGEGVPPVREDVEAPPVDAESAVIARKWAR